MKRIMSAALIALIAFAAPAFAQRTATQTAIFTLTVETTPSNATVTVDGSVISGGSASLRSGSHNVQVTAPGYKPYATVITLRANQKITVVLEPDSVALTINVNVKGATVMVDGLQIRANPVMLSPGTHLVAASAPGYQPFSQSVTLNVPMTLPIILQPVQPASYKLTVTIPGVRGAVVFVDGMQMLRNPMILAAGNHVVKASAPGYQTWEQAISLNGDMTLSIPLAAASYNLTVTIPGVRGATVFVDGVQMLKNPLALSPGNHQVKASAPGYQPWEQTISLNGDMTLTIPLAAASYNLTVSIPGVRGATVFVDGAQMLRNPLALSPGNHQVKASAPGYQNWEQTISMNGDYTLTIRLQPQTWPVTFKADVRNFDLYVDGALQRGNPVQLAPGLHNVRATARGYADYYEDFTVNGPMTVNVTLRQRNAVLIINLRGFGDDDRGRRDRGNAFGLYSVSVDGNAVKLNEDRVEVAPGKHRISISVAGLSTESELLFEAGTQYVIEPVLSVKATPGVFFDMELPASPKPFRPTPTPELDDLFSD